MKSMKGLMEVICDLIRINKYRVGCYERVMNESEVLNMELMEIINNKANESRKNAEELTGLIISFEGHFSEYTVVPGKIFRAWSNTKNILNGKDRKALLNECEWGGR